MPAILRLLLVSSVALLVARRTNDRNVYEQDKMIHPVKCF